MNDPSALQDKTTAFYKEKARQEEKAGDTQSINKSANWSLSLMTLSIVTGAAILILRDAVPPTILGIIPLTAMFMGGDLAVKTLYKASKTEVPSKRRLKAKSITALAMALVVLLGGLAALVIFTHDMLP